MKQFFKVWAIALGIVAAMVVVISAVIELVVLGEWLLGPVGVGIACAVAGTGILAAIWKITG